MLPGRGAGLTLQVLQPFRGWASSRVFTSSRLTYPTASGGKGEGGHLPRTHTTSQQLRSRASCPIYPALCCPGELKLPSAVAIERQDQLSSSYDPGSSSPNYCRWQGVRREEYHPHAHTTSLLMSGRGQLSLVTPSEPAHQDSCHQNQLYCAAQMQCRACSGHFLGKYPRPIGSHAASTYELATVLGPMLKLEDTGLMEVKPKTRSGFPSPTELPGQGHEDKDPGR